MPKKKNDNIPIWEIMENMDNKNYNFYDSLSEEDKKKFSPYMILKWGSCVENDGNVGRYYTLSSNENSNMDFWNISKHPKLQWLACCAMSPKIGRTRHYWIGSVKKGSSNPLKSRLMEIHPSMKEDEIDLLLKMNSEEDIKKWLVEQGLEQK